MAHVNLQQAAAAYPAPRNNDAVPVETPNKPDVDPKHVANVARHLRALLQHRHRNSPRFLLILARLSDSELFAMERAHHEATIAAIQAAQSRKESAARIASARKQQPVAVTSQFELVVTEAMKQAVRRDRSRRGVKR